MKKLTALLLLFTCSIGRAEEIHLYVMAGQSNMFGVVSLAEPPVPPAELLAPQDIPFKFSMQYLPHIQFESDGFIDLQPLSNFTPVYGGPPYRLSTFASELTFGRTLQQRSDVKIAILKVCGNGTSLAVDWNPATPTSLYHRLVDKTGEAVAELAALGYEPTVRGLVWVQGETDAETRINAQNYENNLGNFFDELRTEEWFSPAVPIAFNQMHEDTINVYTDEVRAAQAAVAATRMDNVHLLNNDDLGLAGDGIHYSNATQIEVGRRLADIFAPVPEPATFGMGLASLGVAGAWIRRRGLPRCCE